MRHGFESPDNRLIEPTRKAVQFTKNPVVTTGLPPEDGTLLDLEATGPTLLSGGGRGRGTAFCRQSP